LFDLWYRPHEGSPRNGPGHREREIPADLDQLAAGNDDLAVRGQAAENEECRGRTIVHDYRALGTCQLAQQRFGALAAMPPFAGFAIVFDRAIA
jgi:hypothetical protein